MSFFDRIESTHFRWIAALWAFVLLLQAYITPIHVDEAYYWHYAQNLDWGYFDHPPAVALMIAAGTSVFGGTIGVRLMTVVLHIATLFLLWQIISDAHNQAKNKQTHLSFWLFALSLPLFHIYSLVTTPDSPLLFTSALFLFFYKKTTLRGFWSDYSLLGLAMAAMLYSKYHGVLIIFFVVLSNPRLLLNPRFYWAGVLGLVCFAPHLWWQYAHDYPSVRYHLQERVGISYWYHPFEFLGNMLLILNPIFVGLVWRMLRNTYKNTFERGLYFVFVGFVLFFMFQTLRDHVQPQWLVLIYLPFLVLSIANFEEKQHLFLQKAVLFAAPLLLLLHVALSVESLYSRLPLFVSSALIQRVNAAANGAKVMAFSAYQTAGSIAYTNQDANLHCYNQATDRKNQYNIWFKDTFYHNKPCFLVAGEEPQLPQKKYDGFWGTHFIFKCYEKIDINVLDFALANDSIHVKDLTLTNPYPFEIDFEKDSITMNVYFYKGKEIIQTPSVAVFEPKNLHLQAHQTLHTTMSFARNTQESGITHFGCAPRRAPLVAASVRHIVAISCGGFVSPR